MSLASWRKEFYPRSAKKTSKRNAARHSLRKWVGVKRENRRKHGVVMKTSPYRYLLDADRNIMILNADTCALCHWYSNHFGSEHQCANCPIVKAGCPSCVEENSAYNRFNETGRTSVVIRVLEKAVAFTEKGKK